MGVQPEDRGMDRGCLLRWEAGRDENLTQPDAVCFRWKFQQHPRHFGHKYLKVAGCDCFQHRRRWARSQTQTMYQDVSDEVKDQNDHLSQFGTISIPTCGNIPATSLRQNYCPALSEHVTYIVHFNMLTAVCGRLLRNGGWKAIFSANATRHSGLSQLQWWTWADLLHQGNWSRDVSN